MKRIFFSLCVVALMASCSSQPPVKKTDDENATTVSEKNNSLLFSLDDIDKFVADPNPRYSSNNSADLNISKKEMDAILQDYYVIDREQWLNTYSHVAGLDRTGSLILKDGSIIKWIVRPGGLATLEYPDGKKNYLAKEQSIPRKNK